MKRAVSTPVTLAVLLMLSIAVGWICQTYTDHYTDSGFVFAGIMLLYVTKAHSCTIRFTPANLFFTSVVALGGAYIGFIQEANSAPVAILGGFFALHYGPAVGKDGVASKTSAFQKFFLWPIATLGGFAIITLSAGILDNKIRKAELEQRSLERGCAKVQVLREAVLCYDQDGSLAIADAFFDFKGRQTHYRLHYITDDTAIQTVVGYGTGQLSHRRQVQFLLYDGEIAVQAHGYGIVYDKDGKPDTTSVAIYENNRLLRFEAATPEALQRLHLPAEEGV